MRNALSDGLVLLGLCLYATPIAWQLLTSLTPSGDPADALAGLSLVHYRAVFDASPMPRALGNSVGIAGAATLLAAMLAAPAAYALARLPVPGRRTLLLGIVLSTALPAVATVAPLFLVVRTLGLRDTWLAMILADTSFALPLSIWLLFGFIREVPRELEEAAAVDGAGRLRALHSVVLPVVAPGLAATALLTFLFAWNEFLFAYTFTATEASRTAPVALALFPGVFETPWGDLAAASILASLPPVVLVLALRRHLVRGLLAGALKE